MNKFFSYYLVLMLIIIVVLSITTCNSNSNVEESGYSEESALHHLGKIASNPRPSGSEEHGKVVTYLVDSLKNMGLDADVIEDQGFNYRSIEAGLPLYKVQRKDVKNVIAKIEGLESKQSIALVAHYDSVSMGPGANDNGAAVVALLEAARVLNNKKLKNDVYFIFTDREEEGLIGAEALSNDEFFKGIDYVLNFDARGASGPTYMVGVTSNSYKEINQFHSANPQIKANSSFNFLYGLMRNSTDFMVFKNMGKRGFNFLYIGNGYVYHNPSDNINNINLKGMKQHFLYMYNTVMQFDNYDITNNNLVSKPKAIYFNYLNKFVIFSNSYMYITLSLIIFGFIFLTIRFLRTKPKKVLMGFFYLCSTLAAIAFITLLSSILIKVFLGLILLLSEKVLRITLDTTVLNFTLILLMSFIIAFLLNKIILCYVDSKVYKYLIIANLVVLSIVTTLFAVELSCLYSLLALLVIFIDIITTRRCFYILPCILLTPMYFSFFYIATLAIDVNSMIIIASFMVLCSGLVIDKGNMKIYETIKNSITMG